ncbi:MAG: molecular chaperone DnaJ [Desulfobacterales bacterium SG8_35_2]|jgi:DnaJ like chaperone protein|nr:MAG: molecular chaperone DnaJ [Desulfobacterales bacterium SG8_35_2]
MEYRRHEQPGCGGCFLLLLLLIFLLGGVKALGLLVFLVLFLLLSSIAAFWAFTFYVKRQISAYEKSQTETHNTFVSLLINILVKIAQVDGKVTRDEVKIIRHFFQYNLRYSQSQLYWVKELIKEALVSAASLDSLLQEFRQKFAYEPRLILLELIYQVLYSNDTVSEAELQLAQNIGNYLGISSYDQQTISAKYKAGYSTAAPAEEVLEDKHYTILGLAKGASFSDIKAAYRKLSMQYHPDKVAHLGDEFKKVAEEKMKEINNAYEFLKRKFAQ